MRLTESAAGTISLGSPESPKDPWPSKSRSSACRMSASRPCSTPSPRPRRRRPPTIRSAPSSPTSATWRCPSRAWTRWPRIAKSKEIIPARINFVDVAGLVRGASQGRGARQPVPGQHPRLRRRRLRRPLLRGHRHHPRRGPGRSDRRPGDHRDRADAGRPGEPGKARRQPREARQGRRQGERARRCRLVNLALAELSAGRPARAAKVAPDDEKAWRMLQLLTAKPALYVATSTKAPPSTAMRSPSWWPSAPGATTPRRW